MEISYERLVLKAEDTVDRYSGEAVALSDYLAEHPEVSEREFQSSKRHAELLRRHGFEVEYPFLDIPTAFCAKKSNGEGAKVALLVEYDALPEIGHACGHCLHGAMSTLAGIGLAPLLDEGDIKGTLFVIGTPAEETNGAKVTMAEKGVFDDLDLAIMIHSSGNKSYVRYRSLAMDAMEFSFKGKSAHAASCPWEGRNALNGVQLFFHALDMLRQHIRSEARMHGIIHRGGDAPNIVPEAAACRFYFRAPTRAYLDHLVERIRKISLGAAMATETEVEMKNFEFSFDNMLSNEAAESKMEEIMKGLGIEISEEEGYEGSSDMGNVSHRCPALQPKLAISDEPLVTHSREFAEAVTTSRAHEALILGSRALVRMALAIYCDGDLRRAVREDFERAKHGEELF